jgi:hypothetical protein
MPIGDGRKDDQEIEIAIFRHVATGKGPKEDDLDRMGFVNQATDSLMDEL